MKAQEDREEMENAIKCLKVNQVTTTKMHRHVEKPERSKPSVRLTTILK